MTVIIIRPHRSTPYVDAAYCCRPSSVVCLSVCDSSEPCKNGCTDRDVVWVEDLVSPRNHELDVVQITLWEGAILRGGGIGGPSYIIAILCRVQKLLNRSRCRLGLGLGWAQELSLIHI